MVINSTPYRTLDLLSPLTCDFVASSAASQHNIFYPEIYEVVPVRLVSVAFWAIAYEPALRSAVSPPRKTLG